MVTHVKSSTSVYPQRGGAMRTHALWGGVLSLSLPSLSTAPGGHSQYAERGCCIRAPLLMLKPKPCSFISVDIYVQYVLVITRGMGRRRVHVHQGISHLWLQVLFMSPPPPTHMSHTHTHTHTHTRPTHIHMQL